MWWFCIIAASWAASFDVSLVRSKLDGVLRTHVTTTPDTDESILVVVELKAPLAMSHVLREVARVAPLARIDIVRGDRVQARVPIRDLDALAELSEIRKIRTPHRVAVSTEQMVSQGLNVQDVPRWHAAGLTGDSVRVAVLDVGFSGYEDLLGIELPPSVSTTFLHDGWTTEPHGVAVAEVVHDIVPDATMHFFAASTGTEWLAAADAIATGDFDVAVSSTNLYNVVPGDGSSAYSIAVDAAVMSGTTWVNSAGNMNIWLRTSLLSDVDGDGWLEMDGLEMVPLYAFGGHIFSDLRWEEPWGEASHDVDLHIFDATGIEGTEMPEESVPEEDICGRGIDAQDGDDDPFERVVCTFDSFSVNAVAALRANGESPLGTRAWLSNYYGVHDYSSAHSLMVPCDATLGICVSAVTWDGSPDYPVDLASGRGPTDDGRLKPDMVGPSAVSTVTYDSFTGTSGATPHIAGLAALILEASDFTYAPSDVATWLRGHVLDLGDSGPDFVSGAGLPVVDCDPDELICDLMGNGGGDTGDAGSGDTGADSDAGGVDMADTGEVDTNLPYDTGINASDSDTSDRFDGDRDVESDDELPPAACGGCGTGGPSPIHALFLFVAFAYRARTSEGCGNPV